MIHAHLVCALVAGGGADCAVVVDGDRAAAWTLVYGGTISIASELPFGATPAVTFDLAAPPAPDGARWTAPDPFAATDFLRCAKTTVTATLVGDGVVWRGSIELPRRDCAHPRVRPRMTCAPVPVFFQGPSYDGYQPEPIFDHDAISCDVTLDRAPAVPLHVYARVDDVTADAELTTASGRVELVGHPRAQARVATAITTADGAPVWRSTSAIDRAQEAIEIISEP